MPELTPNGQGSLITAHEKVIPQDQDESYFVAYPEHRERFRAAIPGEWLGSNELYTSPPYTLVVQIKPGLLLKLGSWKRYAEIQNTVLHLNQGRLAIRSYLESLEFDPTNQPQRAPLDRPIKS
jgi:hypothetical protein